MGKNKLHTLSIKTKLGTIYFWIQKQNDGTFCFQMDSCEAHLSRSDLKRLMDEIKSAITN